MTRSFREAASWYQKAAEQGSADGQYILGGLYRMGRGVQQDYRQAVQWFRKSAEQGNQQAYLALGRLYELGQGSSDYLQALSFYRRVAAEGFAGGSEPPGQDVSPRLGCAAR